MKKLAKKTNDELLLILFDLKQKLFAFRFKARMGNLEKPHEFRKNKKNIAQIMGELKRRKLDINKNLQEKYKRDKIAQKFINNKIKKTDDISINKNISKLSTNYKIHNLSNVKLKSKNDSLKKRNH